MLRGAFAKRFEVKRMHYFGNIAYLLMFNSMVFRVPHFLKKYYAPVLMWLEKRLERFQSEATSCCVVGQWRKI